VGLAGKYQSAAGVEYGGEKVDAELLLPIFWNIWLTKKPFFWFDSGLFDNVSRSSLIDHISVVENDETG
jgi:hypothetical protein